ncbi:MAG: tRNA 2-thiouridine(34) synthase MnmA [Patescibacteria group bacterium]|nr:tRNA 2-thiouridine(34) synthase MnmA [Patescibacteria group bacterium]
MKKSIAKKQGKIKVYVAMSGGVDSSVAAFLLKKQGYDVTGVFMRSYNIDGCAEQDAFDARRVAEHLEIPFYVFDFEKEYKKRVVKYMVEGYRKGITPNPDVMCNKEIKFGLFLEKALSLGADYIATGHYIRLASRYISCGTEKFLIYPLSGEKENFSSTDKVFTRINYPRSASVISGKLRTLRLSADQTTQFPDNLPFRSVIYKSRSNSPVSEKFSFFLYEAKDKKKDQSYFLWTLTQDELRYCLFPIGDYLKSEVRAIARKAGLPTAEKKDSQGICFLGNVSIQDFLKNYIKPKKGAILTTDGKKIGEHSGVWFYTIGQRHGMDLKAKNHELKIRGKHDTKPHYVVLKSMKTNTLIVAEGSENSALFEKEIKLTNLSFARPVIRNSLSKIQVLVRVRYRQPLVPATLFLGKQNKARLVFKTPQKFIASGQSAVFYLPVRIRQLVEKADSLELLGGGVIL